MMFSDPLLSSRFSELYFSLLCLESISQAYIRWVFSCVLSTARTAVEDVVTTLRNFLNVIGKPGSSTWLYIKYQIVWEIRLLSQASRGHTVGRGDVMKQPVFFWLWRFPGKFSQGVRLVLGAEWARSLEAGGRSLGTDWSVDDQFASYLGSRCPLCTKLS